MKNIAIPGLLPVVIALMLFLTAIRAHIISKNSNDKRFALSKVICIIGAFIFILLAIFQVLEANGLNTSNISNYFVFLS